MRGFLCALAIVAIAPSAGAADENGKYVIGGGVGSAKCPEFLNSMATARQKGGLNSFGGITEIQGYLMYASGFQTGYNLLSKTGADIFADLGKDDTENALYAIEPWCAGNHTSTFGQALVALSEKLEKAKR